MAYDEKLEARIDAALAKLRNVTPKKMFGGVAYMKDGKMFVGIIKNDLMVRVGPEQHAQALKRPGARPMDFAGRPMKGYVYVSPAAIRTAAALKGWIARALEYVETIEARPARKRAPRPRGWR